MESLFILNSCGTFLVEKHYGIRPLRRDVCSPVLQALCSSRGSSSRRREGVWSWGGGKDRSSSARTALLQQCSHIIENTRDHAALFLMRHADLFFVAVATTEVEPLLVLELLQQIIQALAYYCGTSCTPSATSASEAAGSSLMPHHPAAAAADSFSATAGAIAAGPGSLFDAWGGSTVSSAAPIDAATVAGGGKVLLLTEDAIRHHYSLIFLLLDELCCCGYPATVQANVLQLLVSRPSVLDAALKLVNGSSRMLSSLAASIGLLAAGASGGGGAAAAGGGRPASSSQAGGGAAAGVSASSRSCLSLSFEPGEGMGLGSGHGEGSGISGAGSNCWWRRGGVHYATHEVYVDVTETISAVVGVDGQLLQAYVCGKLLLSSRLSGLPELRLSVRRAHNLLATAAFHPSVRLHSFHRDGILCFCPPDGNFTLASYWLPDTKFVLPVVVSGSVTFPSSPSSSSLSSSAAFAGSSSAFLQQQQQSSSSSPFLFLSGSRSDEQQAFPSSKSPGAVSGVHKNDSSSMSSAAAAAFFPAARISHTAAAAAAGCQRSRNGRVELRLAAFCPVGAAGGGNSSSMHAAAAAGPGRIAAASGAAGEALQLLRVILWLPSSVVAATVTATVGCVRFCPASSALIWDVGSMPYDAPLQRAEGTLTMSVEKDLFVDVPPCEASLVASASFLIRNWVPSGIKVESLEASRVSPPPYKGCRYTTWAGNIEYRIACNSGPA